MNCRGATSIDLSSGLPIASWELTGNDIEIGADSAVGTTNLVVNSTGKYRDNEATYRVNVGGDRDLNLELTGNWDQKTARISAQLNGSVPLDIANEAPTLHKLGVELSGSATVNMVVKGDIDNPHFRGNLSLKNASFSSSSSGIKLEQIDGEATFDEQSLKISKLAGKLEESGDFEAFGVIGLSPVEGFPVNLTLTVTDGYYAQEQLLNADFDLALSLTGKLTDASLLSGNLAIDRMDIVIPENLASATSSLEIEHLNAPGKVVAQETTLGRGADKSDHKLAINTKLDILITAPSNVTVRGYGLNAAVGGKIKISGTSQEPTFTGGLDMLGGSLQVLGRLLEFHKGELRFSKNVAPLLDFEARTEVKSISIFVKVYGDADDPKYLFESTPQLPEEDILALLMFGEQSDNLTATQMGTLALQAATLMSGGPGVVENIEKKIGVDLLDVSVDDEGDASLEFGMQVDKSTYVRIKQGTTAKSTGVKVYFDVSRNIKIRGEQDAVGDSKLGLEYRIDY